MVEFVATGICGARGRSKGNAEENHCGRLLRSFAQKIFDALHMGSRERVHKS